MKKLLSFILIAILCLSVFTGCAAVDTVKGWLGFGEEEPDNISYDIDAAAEYVHTDHMAKVPTITTGDYTVPGQVYIAGVKYTVEWTVDTELVKLSKTTDEKTGAENWLVDVDDRAEAELSYKLTATVKAGDGTTKDVSFNHTVPAYKVLSYAEFIATEDGDPVVIEGVITGIVETSKENDLYLQDEDGGYFVYALEVLPSELGLKVGMTVSVSGLRGTYYKLPQVTDPKVTIIDSSIKTVEPVDITEAFSAAEENVDTNFSQYFSMLVTLKGVKVLGQNSSDSSYYDFSIAGKQSYVRISSSTCMLSADAQTAFQNSVASHINYTADVVGLVANFGGKIYLVPVDENAFSNFVEVVVSNEEKVDYELSKIDLSDVTEDGAVTVPVKGSFYSDVTISWVSDNDCAVVDNTAGTITFTRNNSETTVKLTATVTAGDVTKTKEITITVDGKIFDGTANLTADKLGLGAYDEGEKRVEGIIFGYTELGSYGDGIQMRNKDGKLSTLFNLTELPYGIKRIELVYSATKDTYDNTGAFKFSFGNDATVAAYTVNLDTVKGTKTYTITPDATTYKYFKMEILLTYSFYWAEINIVLDKPVEEHTCEFSTATCTELAKCSICGETQGELANHVYNEETHQCVCDKYDPDWLAIEAEMTIEEALKAPVGKKVKITGVVSEIKSAWSEQFGNMEAWLADADNAEVKILLYRIKTQVEVGDVLVINATIAAYGGVNQIVNDGTTITKVCPHKNMSDATCLLPKTCPDCDYTEGTALDHDFGENNDETECLREGCDVKNPDIHTCEFVFAETVAPTCTAVGYDLYKCSDDTCSETEKRNEVAAIGHKDTDGDYLCDNGECDEVDESSLPAEGTTLTIEQALAIGAVTSTTQKYYITGVVDSFYTNGTTYGNFYIKDADGKSILIYGLYKDGVRYDSMTVKPVIGDTVTVYGTINPYQGVGQFGSTSSKNELIEHIPHTCVPGAEATCTTAQICTVCENVIKAALGHAFGNDGVCANGCGTTQGSEPQWTLVTDASTLKAGDKIVIVAKDYDYALSTTQNSNNRGQASVTKDSNTVTFGDDVQVLTIAEGTTSGTFAFDTGSGYLYAASSSKNYLRTEATLSANSSWTIAVTTDGTATVVAQGTNTRNTMQYNQSSSLFSVYSSASQKAICIYVLK